MLRTYEVIGMPVRIVYNTFGDHDPDGRIYALRGNAQAIVEQVAANPLTPVDLVQPLVIRACVGDTVEIEFENRLPFHASINVKGLTMDVRTSDGSFAGANPNTTVAPGEKALYVLQATQQGVFHFSDLGNPLASELGSNLHGLFGAIVVEAPGSTWTDPETGEPANSGAYLDVHNPFLPSLREYVTIFHDEPEVLDKDGNPPTDPVTGQPQSTMAINYRSEPMRNRMRLIEEGVTCPGCVGEEVHHDSWPFGDPATPVARAYRRDPARFHVVHGAVQETHIFHLHVHQWLNEPGDPDSGVVDSRDISPQTAFSFDVLYGAGSLHRAYGDAIFHCHLYPHFDEGMWSIFRTHDVLEDGTRIYPSGQPIRRLTPLPGRPSPPAPTPEKPGFPFFIPGVFGQRAPLPPLGANRAFSPTPLEIAAFVSNAVPGATFTNPCPPGAPVRHYDVVAIQRDLVYNDAGWHDPEGRLYVLAEDKDAILAGLKKPEPLFIRANSGDCVDLTFTNELPETLGPNAFQPLLKTPFCAAHVHLVKFDPLVSDGSNVGWNYLSGAARNKSIPYRWFADAELRTAFFHDHLFPAIQQQHGLFAALAVEPQGSTYRDPVTDSPTTAGTQVDILNPFLPDFREFGLAVHDFAPLFTADGDPLNPPDVPGVLEDQGVMAFNYTNEPFQIRGGDPAYVFSSFVHGDPATPVFRTYLHDPVRVRFLQGAHEESHALNLHRQKWRAEPDVDSPVVQVRHIGISEAFNLEFAIEGSGDRDFDMLYYSGGLDDLWVGTWGILRSYGQLIPDLAALPDRPAPPARTNPLPVPTGSPPPRATDPGQPCPPGAPVRHFDLVALQKSIAYNAHGDHDPFGMVFVPSDQVPAVLEGGNPHPLIIRANAGDCIEVSLLNKLPATLPGHDHPEVPVPAPWPYSNRVSLHAQLVKYDVLGSDGATVGFNPDQTIGPGETIVYRWYVETPGQEINLTDFGDIMNHRHHGLFGSLVTEAQGSSYRDPRTGAIRNYGPQLDIINPFLPAVRELAVVLHDGVFLLDSAGNPIPQAFVVVPIPPDLDPEDQGMRAFNLRSEPFENRMKAVPEVYRVFSSLFHGDPATPLFEAIVGDPVTIRLFMPADKPRAHSFVLHGHSWRQQSEDLESLVTAGVSAVTIGVGTGIQVLNAISPLRTPGDFMYRSGLIRWDIELGAWGLLRVKRKDESPLLPLPGRS